MKSTYSDGQLRNLYTEYILKNVSLVKFVRMKNLRIHPLRKGFVRLKLPLIPQTVVLRKFRLNENFFENIDTEEKAYMLGFLYADGNVQTDRLQISLAKVDTEILEKFSKLLLDGNVQLYEYKCKNINAQPKVSLYIINKKIVNDLISHGCVPRKTFVLNFPDLQKHLISHFIRGYFDGDGMLVIYERLAPRCITKGKFAEFSILSTKEMLDVIAKYFQHLGINCKWDKRWKNQDNNNYTLRIHGNQQIRKVCDYLYKDATIYLKRKHDKYMELIVLTTK